MDEIVKNIYKKDIFMCNQSYNPVIGLKYWVSRTKKKKYYLSHCLANEDSELMLSEVFH